MKRSKLAEIIVSLSDRVSEIQSSVHNIEGFIGEELLTNSSLTEMMDRYFDESTDLVNINVRELLDMKLDSMKELIDQLVETKSNLTDDEPSTRDRLKNIEELLNKIVNNSPDSIQKEIDKENSYRAQDGKTELPEVPANSVATINKLKGSATLSTLKKGSSLVWSELGAPVLRESLGPIYDLSNAALKGVSTLFDAVGKDLKGNQEKQVKYLSDIRDSLKKSEFDFDRAAEVKRSEETLEGVGDILGWTKGFASMLPKLFKAGAPIALALGAYLLIKNDMDKIYQRLQEAWDNSTEEERQEAAVIVDEQIKNNPDMLGAYGDESVTGYDVPFLSKLNRSTSQVMAAVGQTIDKVTGAGDPDKVRRQPFQSMWNPFSWMGAALDSAYDLAVGNTDTWRSSVEDKPSWLTNWWEGTKYNMHYMTDEVIPYDVAMSGESYLPGNQHGSRNALIREQLLPEEKQARERAASAPTFWDSTRSNNDVKNFTIGNPTLLPNMSVYQTDYSLGQRTPNVMNNSTKVINNYTINRNYEGGSY